MSVNAIHDLLFRNKVLNVSFGSKIFYVYVIRVLPAKHSSFIHLNTRVPSDTPQNIANVVSFSVLSSESELSVHKEYLMLLLFPIIFHKSVS
jgi:hypothetical protein